MDVARNFSSGMSRQEKENRLLEAVPAEDILKILQRRKARDTQPVELAHWPRIVEKLLGPDTGDEERDALETFLGELSDQLSPYSAELDGIAADWLRSCESRRSSPTWVRGDWAIEVVRWCIRLGRCTQGGPPELTGAEWALLVGTPLRVFSELERTVLPAAVMQQALIDDSTAKIEDAAFEDDAQRQRLSGFLSGFQSLAERARRLHAASTREPRDATARNKLDAFVDWLRYRFAQQERAYWQEPGALRAVGQIEAAERMQRLFTAPDLPLGELLRAGRMRATEIHESLQGGVARKFGPAGRVISVRQPLLLLLLLTAERLVVQPVDLGETVLHHIDLDDYSAEDICDEVRTEAACELEPVSRCALLRARCRFAVVDFALTQLADDLDLFLRGEIRRVADQLQAGAMLPASCQPMIEPKTLERENRPCYGKPHLSFTMDAPMVRALLMGTQLWEKSSLAYRELYQNALDACRYRRCRSLDRDVPYVPAIRFHEGVDDKGRRFVECEDNGIGMNLEIVAECFARAGRRFHDTASFVQERIAWRLKDPENVMYPNSQFGIGVFSYFLVAREIEVETSRLTRDAVDPENSRYLIRIPAAASVFTVRTLTTNEIKERWRKRHHERGEPLPGAYRPDAGTIVRLYLSEEQKAEERKGCMVTLKELIWFTDVKLKATAAPAASTTTEAEAAEQPSVLEWQPMRLAPWIAEYVEPLDGIEESQHFWVVRRGLDRIIEAGVPLAGLEGAQLRGWNDRLDSRRPPIGRVLADGIATDHVVPCAIVNLWRDDRRTLSVDRQRIREFPLSRVLARFSEPERLRRRPAIEPVNGEWLDDLAATWPVVCDKLVAQMALEGRSWRHELGFLQSVKHATTWQVPIAERRLWPEGSVFLKWASRGLLGRPTIACTSARLLFSLWLCHAWNFPACVLKDKRLHFSYRLHREPASSVQQLPEFSWMDAEIVLRWNRCRVGALTAGLLNIDINGLGRFIIFNNEILIGAQAGVDLILRS